MDYLKIYQNLIHSAKTHPKIDQYKEKHHIIPKCLGGDNTKENLIMLTAKQHYLAHWLLYKIYKTPKLAYAWHSMCRIGKGQESRLINARLFEYARKNHSIVLRNEQLGNKNHFYGRIHSEDTKQQISNKNKGKIYKNKTQIEQWIESVAKKKKSIDHRAKISRPGFRMIKNKITGENLRIRMEDIINYDTNIWVNPSSLKQKRDTCIYCKLNSTAGNIKRWHNNKCKRKML